MIYMALMELADIDLPFCILNELLEWSLDSHKEDTTDYTKCMSHLQALHLTKKAGKIKFVNNNVK